MNFLPIHASLALQAAPGGGGMGMGVLLIQFGLIFAIFYFLMIRPQKKQRQEHEARLRALKRGDEVVTAGGVVGEIVHIAQGQKDGEAVAAMDDRITIKSGESRLVVERGRIARVGGASGPAAPGDA
jgi:preprotein translocase subunit YajC